MGGSRRTVVWRCVLHRQETGEYPAKSVLKQHKNGLSTRLAADRLPTLSRAQQLSWGWEWPSLAAVRVPSPALFWQV